MTRKLGLFVAGLVAVHAALGWYVHRERPNLGILPPLPSELALRAMSFGDRQFLYRSLVLQIQNAGDTGGRFTPMGKYDLSQVVAWLDLLQRLDTRSSHYTALAVRYFSENRDPDGLRRIISFVERDVAQEPALKWYWQTQAVELAKVKLKDDLVALEVAQRIEPLAPHIPVGYMWVLQMEPVLLADLGRKDEARTRMLSMLETYGARMTDAEKRWTRSFLAQIGN